MQKKWRRNSPNFVLCSPEKSTKVRHKFPLSHTEFCCHLGEISYPWKRYFAWAKSRIDEISATWNFAGDGSEDGRVVIRPFVRIINLWCVCLLKQSLQIERSSILVIDKPSLGEELTKQREKAILGSNVLDPSGYFGQWQGKHDLAEKKKTKTTKQIDTSRVKIQTNNWGS